MSKEEQSKSTKSKKGAVATGFEPTLKATG
jgi:hypothetical protein